MPTVVTVDVASGAVQVRGPDRAKASEPGSSLKPLILLAALRMGVVTPQTRIACSGELRIAGRNLACAHPRSLRVPDAVEALAYSCNSYFATLAEQMPPGAIEKGLQHFGIGAKPATAPKQRALLALGLDRVHVTPLQLAHAYLVLARDLSAPGTATATVQSGLLQSVQYGMAHAADTPGRNLAGKTGTAHDPSPMLQHGWFAGIVYDRPAHAHTVLVVYAPGGNGNDAAAAAHAFLEEKH